MGVIAFGAWSGIHAPKRERKTLDKLFRSFADIDGKCLRVSQDYIITNFKTV